MFYKVFTKISLADYHIYSVKRIWKSLPGEVPFNLLNFFKPQDMDSSCLSIIEVVRQRLGIHIKEWTPKHSDEALTFIVAILQS